ncbi:MAG: prepilin peptidase [Patescibacteria group bacterium]|nr:prepilin peptidase [Patescibacteria group bacterium]
MILVVFILGLIIGSFMNAVIWRMGTGLSVLKGRSVCPHCKHTLRLTDLIPVVSIVLLRGKCRYCSKPISIQYPVVEVATGFIFAFLLWFIGLNILELLVLWILASLLIVIFVYDLKHFIIPDTMVFGSIFLAVVWQVIQGDIISGLISGIGAAAFFFLLFFISKGTWMGFGDVKLALFMGLFLGWPNIIVALFIAFLVGAMVGVALVALKKKGMRSEVPFGPFLLFGSAIAFVLGNTLVDWYYNLLMV